MMLLGALLVGAAGCSSQDDEAADTVFSADAEGGDVLATVASIEGELWQGEKQLQVGDVLSLEQPFEVRKGRASIDLAGGDTVRLYAGTRLSLSATRRVKLWLGKIWVNIIPKKNRRFEVETENAVAGVRGTQFLVAWEAGATRVMVSTGSVAVHNRKHPDREVLLKAQEQSAVEGDNPPQEPVAFEPAIEEESWKALVSEGAVDDAADPAPQPSPDEAVQEASPEVGPQGTAPAPTKNRGPQPGVKVDRAAMEAQERAGEAVEQKVKDEAQQEKKALEEEEKKTRESFEGDRGAMERQLEEDMKRPGSLKPKKDRGGMKKDPDVRDLLK